MSFVPWYAKMVLKICLARLPLCYGVWKKVGIFRHGRMEDPKYALRIFAEHIRAFTGDPSTSVVLELGPGDSLSTALIAASYGFAGSILVDSNDFASHELSSYKKLITYLDQHTGSKTISDEYGTTDDLLKGVNAHYLKEGLCSLQQIPSKSVDFIFSNSVLQHIKKSEFIEEIRELRRILKDGAISSHRVDLKDMLGGSLNQLRFSSDTWETRLFTTSGFYTNRLRCFEILEIFEREGFEVLSLVSRKWETPPIPRQQLAAEFRTISDEELCIQGFDLVLRNTFCG